MTNKTAQQPHAPSPLKDLILLFAIPLGIAAFAAIAVYVPRLFTHPAYDFIYSACSSYDCAQPYTVDDSGHISQRPASYQDYADVATLRYYSTKDDSTKSLTPEEAARFQLNTSSKSPDGYSLTREDTDNGFLLWGSYDSGWYLKDGAKKRKVELSTDYPYNSRDIKFLGWITK